MESYALAVDAIGLEFFSVEEMAAQFQEDLWIGPGHWNNKSEWRLLLNKLPGSKGDARVDKVAIICLGVLWCQSDNFYRAQIVFELLNPVTKPQ